MARPFQWGIVGTGGIARHFAADLALLPDARLAGICSRDMEQAKAFQSEFAAARAYSELDAMAGDPHIDAIYIATPNALHAEQALRMIAHGKAVLIEKPLATSVADAERIASAAASRKCFAMEAMWTRFLPAVRAAKKLVDDGAIGKVTKSTPSLPTAAMKLATAASSTRHSAAARHSTSASIPSRWRFIFWANPQKSRGAGKRRKAASTCAANSI